MKSPEIHPFYGLYNGLDGYLQVFQRVGWGFI